MVYSGSCDMSSVSYTIPWPLKAPSPWSTHGHVFRPVAVVFVKLLGARFPRRATVFTASRWRGSPPSSRGGCDRRGAWAVVASTQVVLDVARAGVLRPPSIHVELEGLGPAELVEDGLHGFADNVREDVQAPAVRHADRHGLDAQFAALSMASLNGMRSRIPRGEPFRSSCTCCSGSSRTCRPRQPVQQHLLALLGVGMRACVLDALAQPVALVPVPEMCMYSYPMLPQ